MTNPSISVIVPIYNVERSIVRCVRSLMEQTMQKGVEFLFVNDCTPDNSMERLYEVLKDYPKRNSQIRIIENEQNLGITATRKKGIEKAYGEYLAWVDSDDWVEPDMLESMWKATKNGTIDIVVQNVYLDCYEKGCLKETKEWKLYGTANPRQALLYYYTDKHIPWGLPFQMSRRSLIIEASKLVHPVNITEDTIMLIYMYSMANSCVWLETSFYHYNIIDDKTSLTHRNYKTKEEWACQVKNIKDVTTFLLQLDDDYKITVNYIKWHWKNMFQSTFDNSWQFWKTYRECYCDAVLFDKTGIDTLQHKIKVWLKYNFYPIYWYKEGRYLFSKKKKRCYI